MAEPLLSLPEVLQVLRATVRLELELILILAVLPILLVLLALAEELVLALVAALVVVAFQLWILHRVVVLEDKVLQCKRILRSGLLPTGVAE